MEPDETHLPFDSLDRGETESTLALRSLTSEIRAGFEVVAGLFAQFEVEPNPVAINETLDRIRWNLRRFSQLIAGLRSVVGELPDAGLNIVLVTRQGQDGVLNSVDLTEESEEFFQELHREFSTKFLEFSRRLRDAKRHAGTSTRRRRRRSRQSGMVRREEEEEEEVVDTLVSLEDEDSGGGASSDSDSDDDGELGDRMERELFPDLFVDPEMSLVVETVQAARMNLEILENLDLDLENTDGLLQEDCTREVGVAVETQAQSQSREIMRPLLALLQEDSNSSDRIRINDEEEEEEEEGEGEMRKRN